MSLNAAVTFAFRLDSDPRQEASPKTCLSVEGE